MKKKTFVGIDVSKKTLDVVVYDSSKKCADSSNYKQVTNDEDGFKELSDWLKTFQRNLGAVVIGMEHTGSYSYELRLFLEKRDIDYCAYNPYHLKHSLGLVRGKNDKVDASRIAHYTFLHREELTYSRLSGSTVLTLQGLLAERKRYVTDRATHMAVLDDTPAKAGKSSAKRIKALIDCLSKQIEAVEEEMEKTMKKDPSVSCNYILLTSIKGIGVVNAIQTIVHTDNFQGFESARRYASYLGIAPFSSTSGTSIKGKPHVGSMGAKKLKSDLTQAARVAIKYDKEMAEYFPRKTGEGKAYGVVLNAVKFKLVCRMFAVIKRQSKFVDLKKYAQAEN